MAKYDVYGLGNALVDKEFEVTEQFLADNGIEKGLMTLIEEDTHFKLLDNLINTYGIKKRAGGGSAANSLVGLTQFGGSAFYACKVSQDEYGQFYSQDLADAGVQTRISELAIEGPTGKCMVMVTPDAERTMNTYLGITADLSVNELFLDELAQAEYLYIEGYLVPSPTACEAIEAAKAKAKAEGIKVAMTFSDPSMVKYFKEGVDKALGNEAIDLLFCNEEEALTFTETDSVAAAAQVLLKRAKKVVITLGPKGVSVFLENSEITVPGHSVDAVDTNGAGDMVAGAFLYGETQGWDDEKSAKLACKAASIVVSHFGPRLTAEQQKEILNAF
ncbi:adenosine kinase [Catenovulum sp. SM1970]|uniref:adenosine kinase n=1 Tax=Marinifaba aquimaris TaxID=2741323 RepID=UPI0015734134|nr:adenosine kinase [Marinifaba aquimaris]NTS75616.1 adenosine kinase [Marinifaba aquimaris]